MVVGLTGGIGSGKSTVLSFFEEKPSVVSYIADSRAKKLMHENQRVKDQLIDCFGKEAYSNGNLNREYIAKIVFDSPQKLEEINRIVHPAVKEDFLNFVSKFEDKLVIYESAILFEANSAKYCDKIISVSAPEEVRIERVLDRDKSSVKEVKSRIKNQWTDPMRNLQSHYVIFNNSVKETRVQVDKIYNILTKNSPSV